ncbi:BRO1-like domain-containing protein [Radiomyces spectabilis]|uniref:BRO1-like domain-containing protein n=1 Tax=Radiomyces spectabilis TaxID=64574 RepID=UPI00221E88DA|nr:BRO1-like domain-containing protein [Radiomyces spectabilis]KAI8374391.1 BRO1-like domain-containing protein [Radiomyces spectabilis]
MSYPYSLPTTGSLSFKDFLEDTGSYSAEVTDATAQRGRVRIALKEFKKETPGSRDYRLILNTIEDYLPYLVAVTNCLESGELKLAKNIETSWRSTLSDHIIHTGSNAPRIVGADIHYELTFVLMTYAYASSMYANDRLRTVQENSDTASNPYNKVADALNTAASIFHYIANDVIPKWRPTSESRPIETIRELPVALSKMALADAQAVAITKALSTGNLSKSLVAKLYIGIAGQYEMAHGLISSMTATQEVSSDLKKYLLDGAQFYKAMAKKFLALDANDNQKLGDAVGFLRDSKADLRAIQHSSISKPHVRKSSVAARAVKEEEAVTELLQKFTMINDTIAYQAVPSRQELQRLIPTGRGVLEMKRYTLPAPAFGSSHEDATNASQSYARSGAYY